MSPSKLIALNATTGQMVWESDYILNVKNFIVDETSSTINILSYGPRLVLENLPLDYFQFKNERRQCIIYQIIDANNGKTILWKDISESFIENNHVPIVSLDGIKDNNMYANSIEFGAIYQIDKMNGDLLEVYRYKDSFSKVAAFYNDYIYIKTDSKLLVLGI